MRKARPEQKWTRSSRASNTSHHWPSRGANSQAFLRRPFLGRRSGDELACRAEGEQHPTRGRKLLPRRVLTAASAAGERRQGISMEPTNDIDLLPSPVTII